jgi:hypothetical protein
MDGWTDRHTGKVNLTATDCCTFEMFPLTLTSVQFTTGYNYSTLKRKPENGQRVCSVYRLQGKWRKRYMGKGTKSQREQNVKGENSLEVIITRMSKRQQKKSSHELGAIEHITIK